MPNSNEYPYNLQGDQTKARNLASQAASGNRDALSRLANIGLDPAGNLMSAPAAPAGQSLQEREMTLREKAFEQSKLDNEQNRLDAQERYNQQVAQSAQAQSGMTARSNRSAGMQDEAQKRAAQQPAPAPKKQAAAPRGGGGGGGRRKPSAAEVAAEKRRDDRVKDRRNQHASARQSGYRDADHRAWEKGKEDFTNKKLQETPSAWDRLNPGGKGPGATGGGLSKGEKPFDPTLPVKNPFKEGPTEFPNAQAYEDWMKKKNGGGTGGAGGSSDKGAPIGFFKRGGRPIPIFAKVA